MYMEGAHLEQFYRNESRLHAFVIVCCKKRFQILTAVAELTMFPRFRKANSPIHGTVKIKSLNKISLKSVLSA